MTFGQKVSATCSVSDAFTLRCFPEFGLHFSTLSTESSTSTERPLRSVSRRRPMAGVLTLTGTKRSLDLAACAGPNGRCTRWCSRKPPAIRRAIRHRPLSHHLDWRYRPIPAHRRAPKLPDDRPRSFTVRIYEAAVRGLRRSAISCRSRWPGGRQHQTATGQSVSARNRQAATPSEQSSRPLSRAAVLRFASAATCQVCDLRPAWTRRRICGMSRWMCA